MKKRINVKNRSAGNVVYTVPDLKVRRDFMPGEIKSIDPEELTQLSYTQGGRLLITQYLQILDVPAREEINGPIEPEYNYGDEEVKDLILNKSLDSFLDALDFAPIGVIDLMKKYAVSLPMVDMNKMAAMKEKLGFDVRAAIDAVNAEKKEEDVVPAPKQTRRRVPVEGAEEKSKKSGGRRTKVASEE